MLLCSIDITLFQFGVCGFLYPPLYFSLFSLSHFLTLSLLSLTVSFSLSLSLSLFLSLSFFSSLHTLCLSLSLSFLYLSLFSISLFSLSLSLYIDIYIYPTPALSPLRRSLALSSSDKSLEKSNVGNRCIRTYYEQ